MWIHLVSLELIDGAGGAVAPPVVTPAASSGSGDATALTWSQHKRLLERIRRLKALREPERELVEAAYEALPEKAQERLAEQVAPVLVESDGERRRIAVRMSERKREAVVAILEAYLLHERQREEDDFVVSMI